MTIDQIGSVAELLAGMSTRDAISQMLDQHSPDPSGHCRGCRYPTVAAPVWPCRLWAIAEEAQRIQERRAAR